MKTLQVGNISRPGTVMKHSPSRPQSSMKNVAGSRPASTLGSHEKRSPSSYENKPSSHEQMLSSSHDRSKSARNTLKTRPLSGSIQKPPPDNGDSAPKLDINILNSQANADEVITTPRPPTANKPLRPRSGTVRPITARPNTANTTPRPTLERHTTKINIPVQDTGLTSKRWQDRPLCFKFLCENEEVYFLFNHPKTNLLNTFNRPRSIRYRKMPSLEESQKIAYN